MNHRPHLPFVFRFIWLLLRSPALVPFVLWTAAGDFITTAKRVLREDPAAKSLGEVLFLYPGLKAVFWHRWAHLLYQEECYFLARLICQFNRFCTGIEIHPGASLGRDIFIDHGMGVVIGETAVIGDKCTLYHGVTLGGTSKRQIKRHPTVGRNVVLGARATIIGPVHIGDDARIAAGALIIEDIAEGITVGLHSTKTDLSGAVQRKITPPEV